MKEFLFVFRSAQALRETQPSAEELQAMMKPWQDWMGSIAAQNKLSNPGGRLETEGIVIKPDKVITNGPYVEIKEAIGGYIVVKSASIDEAVNLAKECPILAAGGSVEVRPIASMDK